MQVKLVAVAVISASLFSFATPATADTTDALILNQANAVSGGKYLKAGKTDASYGRVEGNGQNWMQLLVSKTDPNKNTLNLQGYQIDWSYSKDAQDYGSGVITFSNDSAWAQVPLGTAITVNESQQAWYLINTPDISTGNPDGDVVNGGGMQRDGQIDGLGILHGTAYTGDPSVEKLLDFSSNTAWNPYAPASGNMQPGPNWSINVWAGQQSGGQFQYFNFSGSVTAAGVTSAIGTDAAGLFTVNNDNWQFTIKDAQGNVVQGPIGEAIKPGWVAGGVGSQEVIKLQAFPTGTGATLSDYQNVNIANYASGSSSGYGGPVQWTDTVAGALTQDLGPLRDWFNNIRPGDVNLDGIVNSQDLANVSSNWLRTGVGLLSGDVNGDGIVNSQDLATISSNWLQAGGAPVSAGASSVASVPEPATFLLCAIGIVAGLLGRRRLGR